MPEDKIENKKPEDIKVGATSEAEGQCVDVTLLQFFDALALTCKNPQLRALRFGGSWCHAGVVDERIGRPWLGGTFTAPASTARCRG